MTTNVSYRLFEAALASKHVPVLITGEGTHDAALAFVAQLVPFTQDGDYVSAIVAGALPAAYAGDTLKQVPEMLRSAIRKRFDQNVPMFSGSQKKRTPVDDAVDLFFAMGGEVFTCKSRYGYVSIPTPEGGSINYLASSSVFADYIMTQFIRKAGGILSSFQISEVVHVLRSIGAAEGATEQVAVRMGGTQQRFYIDLARKDGQLVEIDAEGYRLTYRSEIKMVRTQSLAEMPLPLIGDAHSGLDAFSRLLLLEGDTKTEVLGFMIASLSPVGPYPCLLVEGQQGSGKSMLCEFIKDVLDPGVAKSNRLPKDEHNLMISASRRHVSVFDNASYISEELSNSLCCLSTGGGFEMRKLYTDNEVINFDLTKPFILNGISSMVRRPDLMERAIPIELRPIDAGQRQDPQEMLAEFYRIRPLMLHDLFTALSASVARLSATRIPKGIRMAGAARWVTAAESALGFEFEQFITAFKNNQDAAQGDLVRNNPIAERLVHVLKAYTSESPFNGIMTELFAKMMVGYQPSRNFPSDAGQMGKKLRELAPALRAIDVFIEFGREANKRSVTAWLGTRFPKEWIRPDF